MTDEALQYKAVGKEYASRGHVEHSKDEYVKDGYIHTNTVEGFYSIFKRGMKGIYQHVPRSIFIGICASSISATRTASSLALMARCAVISPWKASRASG